MEKASKTKIKTITKYQKNGIVSNRILESKNGGITVFAFDKGQRLSEHTAPFDATIIVLEGSAEILIDQKPHVLKEGELIIMPANIPHAVNAIEKFKMMLIMVR